MILRSIILSCPHCLDLVFFPHWGISFFPMFIFDKLKCSEVIGYPREQIKLIEKSALPDLMPVTRPTRMRVTSCNPRGFSLILKLEICTLRICLLI